MVQPTTFRTALPYAGLTLAAGIAGAALAVTASSTAMAISGIALGLFGSYAFFGVVTCGYRYGGRPEAFKRNVWQYVATSAGAAISDIITTIVKSVLVNLINDWLYGRQDRRYQG